MKQMLPGHRQDKNHSKLNPWRTSRWMLGLLIVLSLSLTISAAGQSVIGSLDIANQTTMIGWACVPGDASTKVTVDLLAWDPDRKVWVLIGTERADKARDNIGNTGICGKGEESFYHGFEYTILPNNLMKEGSSYDLRAYVNDGPNYRQLSGHGSASFVTSGLPTSSIWRTDYDDPDARSVSMVSCIWPFKGANGRGNTDPDPLHLHAGATMITSWEPEVPGVLAGPNWCIRNDPSDPSSWPWSSSNSATNESGPWPTTNYWVVSANKEIAYSKTQSGPPSQSASINGGGVYSVSMTNDTFQLGVDNRGSDYRDVDFPFLSLGSEMGRGVSGPLAWLEDTSEIYLEFQVLPLVHSSGHFHDIYVNVEFMWGGV